MSDDHEFKSYARLEAAVGGISALKICAFFGGGALHIPTRIDESHALVKLVGARDAGYLAAELGGSDCWIPKLELKTLRRAGELRRLLRGGQASNATACASLLGVSPRAARRAAAALLELEGYSPALLPEVDSPLDKGTKL